MIARGRAGGAPILAMVILASGSAFAAEPQPFKPPADAKLARQLGAAAVSEDENPLLEIARQMRQVEGLIGQAQSGPKTQQMQGQIVAELEKLLKQACRSGGSCKPSPGKPPGTTPRQQVAQPQPKPGPKPGSQGDKAAKTSGERQGGPEARRAADVGQAISVLQRRWGELPERAREQMLQLLPREEFLPKYELLIEEYYKRLAEEKKE